MQLSLVGMIPNYGRLATLSAGPLTRKRDIQDISPGFTES